MKRTVFFLGLIIALAACRPTAAPATARPRPTDTAAPAPSPLPTNTPALPASTLFDFGWDDRAPFAAGLLPAEQAALNQPAGAGVYHLDLTIAPDMTHMQGREEVRYTNQEAGPLDEIYFRLFPNLLGGRSEVSTVAVNNQPVTPRFTLQNSVMIVPLPEPLLPGQAAVIGLEFAVEVPTEAGANYASFAWLDDVLALAHSYPLIAVYDDAGWNVEIPPDYGDVVYADEAFFLARVTAPADQILAASGLEIEASSNGETQTVVFAAGPARDFYLAAGNRYEVTSRQVGQTTLNTYTFPRDAASAEMMLGYAADAMQVFGNRLGTYPFTELDIVATPTLAGGIEYPGVIVLANSLFNGRPGGFLEIATVHEVGHQWFYSAVGNNQIDNPWLDESLTQYLTWLYFKDIHGPSGDESFRQVLRNYWQRADFAETPIGLPVAAYTEAEYGAIVYGRGPLFFNALAETMGQDTFDAFLKDYYQTNQWGIATPDALKMQAEQVCRCDLTPLFDAWVFAPQ